MLGDATKEVAISDSSNGGSGNWFSDFAYFVDPMYPWMGRSGNWNDTSGAGIFYFYHNYGGASTHCSSRAVLAF